MFGPNAAEFILQTDASAVGLGAVLEQDGHPIANASRSLTKSERNYNVIQRECLAIVFSWKQFRHYLLGRQFKLYTDHAPIQWLSAQKMEGMLCRWSLAIQEYDFAIVYRKGSANSNADALSRITTSPCAARPPCQSVERCCFVHCSSSLFDDHQVQSGINHHSTGINKFGINSK